MVQESTPAAKAGGWIGFVIFALATFALAGLNVGSLDIPVGYHQDCSYEMRGCSTLGCRNLRQRQRTQVSS